VRQLAAWERLRLAGSLKVLREPPGDNADEAAPPAPEGLVGPLELDVRRNVKIGDLVDRVIPETHQQTSP
jgi:hypothetical protein